MVRDEMMKADGFVWGVNVGLHAIPSMRWAGQGRAGEGVED